jgi:hypothetical protein
MTKKELLDLIEVTEVRRFRGPFDMGHVMIFTITIEKKWKATEHCCKKYPMTKKQWIQKAKIAYLNKILNEK